jgi:N-acetylmuramoyl-L-alanine amidase
MDVRDHLLFGERVIQKETPNKGGAIAPEYLIIHYTAGRSGQSSVDHFCQPSAKASAHLVIGREGEIWQLVPFNRKAWHAGVSAWAGREGVNGFSIGIELDNAGKLDKVGESFQAWFGAKIPADQVIQARHKNAADMAYWHAYPEAQINATLAVAELLAETYRLHDVLGHDDIAPGRKVDPGPAFPMRSFRSAVFGRGEDEPEHYEVATDLLNVRAGPGTEFQPVRPPVVRGARLSLLEMQSLWAKVMLTDGTRQEGWVRNSFIKSVA